MKIEYEKWKMKDKVQNREVIFEIESEKWGEGTFYQAGLGQDEVYHVLTAFAPKIYSVSLWKFWIEN